MTHKNSNASSKAPSPLEQKGGGAIVLVCKRPGVTSFESLYQIKRAFGTRKVGHTGTLDSFATGLLVVCAGHLTRLVPYITQFDKTYEAVIEFGAETDTLEWTGNVVRTAPLPDFDRVKAAVQKFTGSIMQQPPQFSAIHIEGKRASDIARSGGQAIIPARAVKVYAAKITETLLQKDDGECVSVAPDVKQPSQGNPLSMLPLNAKTAAIKAVFKVSKGTYIRSLARDIGAECGSAARLAALRRTAVGPFSLEDAALYDTLMPLTIDGALKKDIGGHRIGEVAKGITEDEAIRDIIAKSTALTEGLAKQCGFKVVTLTDELKACVIHGRQTSQLCKAAGEGTAALFDSKGRFLSLYEGGHRKFVLPFPPGPSPAS